MPSAAIVDDRAHFALDVYEDRGGAFVKVTTIGPFLATDAEARDQLKRAIDANARHLTERPRKVIASRYNQQLKRWFQWR